MSDARYVQTKAIRSAVVGREAEVLEALGVDWRSGRPHITCPYPEHADRNASWRWDERTAKAHCTCSRAHSIFDVFVKIRGGSFEAAKIEIAEVLGARDLIRTKRNGSKTYQQVDAVSLLQAPAEARDDRLPLVYLAHRLGVAVEAVPVPATPLAGLTALGYYDPPPPGSKAKPAFVGEYPCAVFGTVAADGGRHAHRIYLAPGGAGKADLGCTPDGKARDPKKSARNVGDEKTAGRSVLWGEPKQAPHLIVSEGIETAAAVAYAMAAEIAAGEVAVAAAITAGGVEAFQPYPATARITVAADRDEAPKPDGRPGSRRGEQAARGFAFQHHHRIAVAVALPGVPGESIDWLDVLRCDGPNVVRDELRAGEPFVPTAAECAEATRKRRRQDQLQELSATYPLPVMETMTLVYRHTASGKVMVHKQLVSKDDVALVPVTTPFGIMARLRHLDQASAYGLRCRVQDMNGQPRDVDLDRATLAKQGATEVRAALFEAGLRTEDDGEIIAVRALKAADPASEILIVSRPGWHELGAGAAAVFVSPGGKVIASPPRADLELAAAVRMAPEVAAAGTLEGWRRAIDAALSVVGCPHWTLGVVAAFAGPVVALTGLDTCGINLSGLSSSGKSKAQRLGVSAWSTPDIRRPGLSQSARATDNAVEALAQRATGTVLALDELGHVNGKVAAAMIYTIAGGVGKRRMDADARIKDSYAWSTFAILSGECSLEEKIRSDGGEWLAGMAVRIVDIDVTDVNRGVHPEALRQIDQIEQHYGHAGPAFIRALMDHDLHRQAGALRERILAASRGLAGEDADSATIRAATPLALLLICGELAKSFGLIPQAALVQEAVSWAWERFCASPDATALDPDEQALAAVRGWVAERWDVTIKSVDGDRGINNREAVAWYDDTAIYIPKGRLREAAGGTLRESQVASIIARRGLLEKRPEPDRLYVRSVPKVGKVQAYALSRAEFGCSRQTFGRESYAVYEGAAA